MKELHAYWMAPLKPSPTQRTAQTMCKLKLTPKSIAVDQVVTCSACISQLEASVARAEAMITPGEDVPPAFHRNFMKMVALLPQGNPTKKKYAEVNHKVK